VGETHRELKDIGLLPFFYYVKINTQYLEFRFKT
jgi:hypothetical protein